MEEIKNYKCPCCGAPLVFSGEKQKLHCESCGAELETDAVREFAEADERVCGDSKYDWDTYTPRDFGEAEKQGVSSYSCPSCGAEIAGDSSLGACTCPYCGNAAIVKHSFEGAYMPDYVVPFKIDKGSAMKKLLENAKKKIFIPKAFKDETRLKEITGMYVPFWMFDCDVDGEATFRGIRTHVWSDRNYNYTRTDHYMLYRSGSAVFKNVPVDASTKAEDAYMDAIEPFDCREAMDFDTAYLSGYLADKYDVSAEDSINRANERIKQSFSDMLRSTTAGYGTVSVNGTRVDFSNGKIRYALMPVWWLNVKYRDKMYRFAMNGQTGKAVGDYPVDRAKLAAFFGCTFAVLGAIAAVMWYFI